MANEFYRRGISKVYWLATAPVVPASPTAVEISAGIDLSPQLNAIDGFSLKTTFIDVENLGSRVTPTISGPLKAEGGTLTLNEKRATSGATSPTFDPIITALALDSAGFLLLAPYGVVGGNDCEIWPSRVGSFSRKWDLGNTPSQWMSEMAATDVPNQHAVIGIYATAVTMVPTSLSVAAAGGTIKKQVLNATMSDASTVNVSSLATWTSSDPTKATVSPGGFVTAVLAGPTTVTATYVSPTGQSFSATCAVTVT